MKIHHFLIIPGILLYSSLQAQIRVGEWRDHLAYNSAFRIAAAPGKIYCATHGSMFWVDQKDHSLHKFSTVDGLSDINISTLRYNTATNILMVGYVSGKIDLIQNGIVSHITDIYDKHNLTNKEINNIMFVGDKAYLACGFGIVVLNLSRLEISDTYYIGEGGGQTVVNDLCTDGTYLYAATDMGVYKAELNNPNLVNFAYWLKDTQVPNSNGRFTSVAYYNDKLFTLSAGSSSHASHIYYSEGSSWMEFSPGFESGTVFYALHTQDDQLILTRTHEVDIYNNALQLIRQVGSWDPFDAWIDEENSLWVADFTTGLARFDGNGQKTSVIPNGPVSSRSFRLGSLPGGVMVAAGGFDNSWTGIFFQGEISTFLNNQWNSWVSDSLRDVVTLTANPANPAQFYAGTWGYGVYEFTNGVKSRVFNPSNSTLQNINNWDGYCRIYGIAFDRDNNLWVTNSGVPNPISVRLNNGTWKSLPYSAQINAPNVADILITSQNIKWVVLPKGYGLFAFDDKGTLDNINDDQYVRFQPVDEDGKIISSQVYDIAEDHEGNIWVGTSTGPVVYYNPGAVFDEGGIYAHQILIPRNDGTIFADILLGTEAVTAIAIDGADRKWFGTANSGVFLMSADGLKQVHHFTTDNSPLLSNTISDIAIDGKNGEVFFATPNGVVSYRDAATQGGDAFGKVYVFPNPVRENYHGVVTVTGLVSNVSVKITDISGNLVYETTALGGQAIWDGKNFDGRRVATGVYLIFCTNDDGSQTYITKLLFVH